MIHLDKRALVHLGISDKFTTIYPGIGSYGDYLHSDKLSKFKWSSAPFLSPEELITLVYVQRQFGVPYGNRARDNYWLEFSLVRKYQPEPDLELYDLLYEAIDKDLEYTPLPMSGEYFEPYTDESLMRSALPGGVCYHDVVKTDKDFLELSPDKKDIFILEYCMFFALKYLIVGTKYQKVNENDISHFLDKGKHHATRNHSLYEARKWASIRVIYLRPDMLKADLLGNHISNRRVLEYMA